MDLLYVHELVRHGARAPLLGSSLFPVASEQLTPKGMRQRYLLGRYNFETFGQRFDFGAPATDLQNQLQVQSTDVYRTIQSGYSELAGMVIKN